MTKYTLLIDPKSNRNIKGVFPLKNGSMFVLFVIGVIIGVSFGVMYRQYQTMTINPISYQSYQYGIHSDDEQTNVGLANRTNTKHSHENDEVHTIENRTFATKLYHDVRIVCVVETTLKNNQTYATSIKQTWGAKCNKLMFVCTDHDATLNAVALNVKEDKSSMAWTRTKRIFQYVYEHHHIDGDWFLKVEDNTFVILENLRYFLSAYSSNDPIYFGYKMNQPNILKYGYNDGGAGYVLSLNALERFHNVMNHNDVRSSCHMDSNQSADIQMGKCMEALGVLTGDTRDDMKRGRFFPNTPEAHLIPGKMVRNNVWYRSHEGIDCCSDNAITFHQLRNDQMYSMNYLIYHLRPYGIVPFPQPLPMKVNFGQIAVQLRDEKPDSTHF